MIEVKRWFYAYTSSDLITSRVKQTFSFFFLGFVMMYSAFGKTSSGQLTCGVSNSNFIIMKVVYVQ